MKLLSKETIILISTYETRAMSPLALCALLALWVDHTEDFPSYAVFAHISEEGPGEAQHYDAGSFGEAA